ncbi:MAG: NAD(P)/FAD-dependent oxidoreductase [Oligoflexales bacterium]|nr:NAD(P)/FAD-dependent oxidoreductase [Oligoflexales bacterium]
MSNESVKREVVIVGGGFGGLSAAKVLGNRKDVNVIVIDKMNHHLFQPLLYQVATAGLNPADIAMPIRAILGRYKNIQIYLDEAVSVDSKSKILKTRSNEFKFDYLILACGVSHSYFGNDHWEPYAPGLKTLAQALNIREGILKVFEKAEKERDPVKQRALLTFVVIGGGPTGVELAGALGELTRYSLGGEFRKIDPSNARIILLERSERILSGFSEKLSISAKRQLEELGVEVWVSSKVTTIEKDGIILSDEKIKASNILWAAGVKAPEINKSLDVKLTREGLVPTLSDLSISSSKDIFVIGDQGVFINEKGERLTGLSPIAVQGGILVAKNILREIRNIPRKPFRYFDRGKMATIGRSRAIAKIGFLELSGFVAWLSWIFVHIYYLIGFKNRIVVMIEWAISYFTFKKGARLIVNQNEGSTESIRYKTADMGL